MIEFNKDLNFNEIINSNDLVLFYFSQENCTRCKTLELQINEYLNNHDLLVYHVDVKTNMKLIRNLNIYASPCVILYYKKEIKYRNLGLFSFDEVANLIDKIN